MKAPKILHKSAQCPYKNFPGNYNFVVNIPYPLFVMIFIIKSISDFLVCYSFYTYPSGPEI